MLRRVDLPLAPLLLLAVLASLTPSARADNSNAAVWYQRAIEVMQGRLSREDLDYLADYAASASIIPEPTPELRRIVARARNAVDFARRGSRQAFSDFELDYAQGLELTMPQLMPLRQLEQVMRADAMVRLADGDGDGAVDVLASSYRMAGHLSDDRVLISSLVGSAIFRHADGGTRYALDQAALSPEQSATLLEAVGGLDAGDPFGIVDSVAMEQEVMIDWLGRRFEEDGGGAQIADELLSLRVDEELADEFAAMDGESFSAAMHQYDQVMDDVIGAFSVEDPDAAQAMLERIDAELQSGAHGLVAQMIGAEYTKVYGHLLKSRQAVGERARVLEQLASGAITAADEANAAALYLEAIERLHALPHLEVLRATDAAPGETHPPELLELLSLAGPVVDTVRRASLTKRCDFTFARFGAWPTVAQQYAPGLRDLYRLLHVDARRRLEAGGLDDARDRLETAYRMTAHLALDETLVTSLVADAGCRRTHDLVELLLERDGLPAEAKEAMFTAFRRIGRADGFGYLAAIRWEQERIAGTIASLEPGDAVAPERAARIQAIVGAWDGDRVLAWLAVLETVIRARPDHAPRCPEVELDGLDVLSESGLDGVRAEAAALGAPLAAADAAVLAEEREWPSIADVDRHVAGARSVLRRGYAMLRPEGVSRGTVDPEGVAPEPTP